MTQTDQVRQYVRDYLVEPARREGRSLVKVRAGDIHSAMGLQQRMPLVCSALDADKFLVYARVRLLERTGPKQSSTSEWVFGLK